jgi:TolB-like protein/DNA-binding winged helix-turn-helix (wHTH) protein/Tfp pilus assembly protein PilF
MRLAEDASVERGRHYTGPASEVLPSVGNFSEIFLKSAVSSPIKQFYEFGPFRLDPAAHTLWRDGRAIPLRPKVFDMLLMLVENSGRLVEKEKLLRAIWPEQFVEEGNLNKTISALRQALAEGENGNKYIETVPKRGYRFMADVREVSDDGGDAELVLETRTRLIIEEETDDDLPPADDRALAADALAVKPIIETTAVPAQLAGKSERGLKSWAIPAAAAVIVALAAAIYLFQPRGGAEAIDSVAVLPFANEGGDMGAEYLSDGISESLTDSLSRLPGLKVTAKSSSFKYKGKQVDPQEAARSLGVRAILTGRVSRRGDTLFISAELTDARDGTQVWGERYSRRESDLLGVQAEISGQIARALRLRLTPVQQEQLAKPETVSPVAYELLLKGRFYLGKGTESEKKAIEYFNQAIAVDPHYALAYAELSFIYGSLVNSNVLDQKEFIPKAEMAARKALELDGDLAAAHEAMAYVNLHAWDWAAAEREYKRAIELNPNLAGAHSGYAFYLDIQGRSDEAIAEMKRARELNPLGRDAKGAAVYELAMARQYDQALEAAKKLVELDRSNPHRHELLGSNYAWLGQYAEAIASFKEAIKLGDDTPDTQIALGKAYAKIGEHEKARAILKQLEAGKEYVSPVGLAILHAALGEREQALALLERAYSAHDQQLIWLGIESRSEGGSFAALRSDPRFQDLMRRIGLPL